MENRKDKAAEQTQGPRTELTAHTPGPWMADEDPMTPGHAMTIVVRAGESSMNGDWIAIAFRKEELNDETCSITKAKAEANAKLMAAAPDLLEALRELVADSDDVDDGKLPTISAASLVRARQVIAKASGAP